MSPAVTEYSCEVAVIGGGPVGVTLAHLLGSLGLDTIVFERETSIHATPRAVGVDDLGLRVWQRCGLPDALWPDMTPLGEDAAGMVFQSRKGCPLIGWRPVQKPFGWPRGVTMVQTEVEARLRAGLDDSPRARFLPGHDVTDVSQSGDGCLLQGQRPNGAFRAASLWTVGCEGGRSLTRRAMGVDMPGREGTSRWLIVDTVESGPGHRSTIDVEIFGAAPHTVVSVPRKDGHRRWEFRLAEQAPDETPPDDQIRKLIEENGGPATADIRRALIYRFATRQVTKYALGRLALAGDAAHVMAPYAAQGLTCGLGDAANLYWRLWLISRHGANGRRLLSDYDAERRAAIRRSQYLTGLMGAMVAPGGRSGQIIRDRIISTAVALPAVRKVLTGGDMRAFSRYPGGTFLRRGPGGYILPNLKVNEEELLDDHLGNSFTLLVNAPGDFIADTPSAGFWHSLNAKILPISTGSSNDGLKLSPPSGRWKRWLSGQRVLIVRPDRVVFASGRVDELQRLTGECARAMGLVPL